MKHDAAWYTNAFEIMNKTEILLVFLLFGLCFAALIKPYVKKRLTVTAAGVLTALEGALIWLLSDNGGTLSYSIVMFSAFVLMYLCEKERPLQKIFLCAMFLSLRFICSALLVEWGFLSIWIDINIGNISAKMDPDQIIVFYALSRMMNVIVRTLILYAMIRLFRKAYRRNEELSFKELLLLLIPTVTPLLEGAVFMEYVSIYAQGVENGYIQNNKIKVSKVVLS